MTAPSPVQVLRRDRAAVLLIDNPPVNALSHAVRSGIADALGQLELDPEVEGIVIACAGKTFVAGADIREFGKAPVPPSLPDVIAKLDAMTKPVAAALHGTVLGGGLELALGCHFRLAAPSTRLGLPEVKLGLIPGAGGTQRLPRAIGASAALRMIAGGEPVSADDALRSGLIDEIVGGDLTEAALAAARRLARPGQLRRLRDEKDKLGPDIADRTAFEALAAELSARAGRLEAPRAAIEAVRGALDLPFDDGLARERALFAKLRAGEQSKALRHLFFAEREAAKVPDLPADARARSVAQAAVIGAGTMGRGIAMCFADAGIKVALIDTSNEALANGRAAIEAAYGSGRRRGRIDAATANARLALIRGDVSLEAAGDADLVVEAVFEDMALKQRIFAELDRTTRPDAILATNTSYLDVDDIARATGRSALVAGMHFFSPANVMRLVEIVRGARTAPETLATLIAVARRLGKVPVVVGNAHGFVGNRMLRQRNEAAERLLLEGAQPEEIDAAMMEFGFPMGPLAASDLAGLDIGWRMRKASGLRAEVADALCERGRFGQKTGAGFYRYEPGSRTPLPDPAVGEIAAEAARRFGIQTSTHNRDEITVRLLYPMVNEAARILEEGIATRSGDIDLIWVHGYGWPNWRGGPMFWADSVGAPAIRDRLRSMSEQMADERLRPAPLLEQLADENRPFASLAPR